MVMMKRHARGDKLQFTTFPALEPSADSPPPGEPFDIWQMPNEAEREPCVALTKKVSKKKLDSVITDCVVHSRLCGPSGGRKVNINACKAYNKKYQTMIGDAEA